MRWEYQAIPFAAGMKAGGDRSQAVAQQFQSMLTEWMARGFEYQRTDHVSLYEAPGCLAGLFGARAVEIRFDLAVFRRPLPE
jgi:hypothetical protein